MPWLKWFSLAQPNHFSSGSREGRVPLVHSKAPVIVSPVVPGLEEVGSPIVPLQRPFNVVREAPQRNVLWILISSHMRLTLRIEFPIFRIFEEVNLAISTPHKSSVNIARDPWKSIFDILWISRICLHILKFPILRAFDEICCSS